MDPLSEQACQDTGYLDIQDGYRASEKLVAAFQDYRPRRSERTATAKGRSNINVSLGYQLQQVAYYGQIVETRHAAHATWSTSTWRILANAVYGTLNRLAAGGDEWLFRPALCSVFQQR